LFCPRSAKVQLSVQSQPLLLTHFLLSNMMLIIK